MKLRKFVNTAIVCAVLCVISNLSGCSTINENVFIDIPADHTGGLSVDIAADKKSYISGSLTEKEREYYEILKEAVYNFEEYAVFPEKVEIETLRKLFVGVYYQEEDLYWLTSIFYRPVEPTDTLKLSYRFSKEESSSMQQEIDEVCGRIFSEFDDTTTDYEKLKAFHDYIVLNCTFNMESQYANTIYGALVDGYAQCEGYAFAFDYLCMLADIECYSVIGTNPEGAAHAWNTVMLDGKMYHVDCTWDDPILDPPDTEFIRYYYFLVNDSDISGVTHIPDSTYFPAVLCTDTDNYYLREGYTASSAKQGEELLSKAAADALMAGRKDAAVRFTDKKAYNDAVSRLFDSRGIKNVFAYANSVSPRKVLDGKYIRYCNDDELIIHISMIYDGE